MDGSAVSSNFLASYVQFFRLAHSQCPTLEKRGVIVVHWADLLGIPEFWPIVAIPAILCLGAIFIALLAYNPSGDV